MIAASHGLASADAIAIGTHPAAGDTTNPADEPPPKVVPKRAKRRYPKNGDEKKAAKGAAA